MANIAFLLSARQLQTLELQTQFPSLSLPALPLLPRGLVRGAITEIVGVSSTGRMASMLHILAQATGRGEICAIVDTDDQFHPASASASGVTLANIIWVRCGGSAERSMRAADLRLHSGGFGVVVLDLCETKALALNRIPMSYWYRFRRAIENTSTSLLVCSPVSQAKASTSHMELGSARPRWTGTLPFRRLERLEVSAHMRKPAVGRSNLLSLEVIA
jgi:hypothetical protein